MATARRRELTLLLVLQFAHLVLVSAQVPIRGKTTLLETIVFAAIAPFQRMAMATVRTVTGVYTNYFDLRGARDRSESLEKELESARLELNRMRGERGELERLRNLLHLAEGLPYRSEPALIIGADALNPIKTLFIDKGSRHGVRQNCPVISPEGFLVGRVITPISPSQATVQLITDIDANVGAILAGSRTFGVLNGLGDGKCALRFVPNSVEVAIREEVLTSGLDQIYPRGLIVGHVVSGTQGHSVFKEVVVQPAMAVARLEHVLVLIGDKPGETGPGGGSE